MKSKYSGRIIADTSIRISSEAKLELTKIGTKNQSYDQVIHELILEYKALH